jgi:tetratricopeptide (TPR) repeat protein
MALARAYLGAKQLEDAAAIFEQCFDVSKSQWLAHYLSAVIHSKLGNHEQAARLFEVCFDLDPDRAEPLMRLAEVAIAADNLSVARKLLDVIVQMPSPAVSDYLEPSIYRYQARLLAAELALQSKDMESAASYLNPLLHTPHIPSQDQARITQLKNNLKFRPGVPPEDRTASKLSDASSTPKLTVGMATYDDFHGVYFSIMSILLHHAEDLSAVEILVIDNNPSSEHGLAVKHLCERARYTRYIAASEYTGTAVRERVFVEARGDFVLCMDCHVLLHLGALKQLLRYINDNPRSNDLLHGPLIYDNQEIYSTHMEPRWNSGFYGVWGTDERGQYADAKPFEIPLQGLGLFACRRTQWPSFNLRFRGFGGEEGYIHEKFRQRGGKVLCLPFLRWTHRFQRPGGTSYENRWEDRVRNYLLGWREMGMDSEAALDHFSDMISDESVAKLNAEVVWEQRSVFWGFDTIFGLASSDEVWQAGLPLLQRHGIHRVCRRVVDTATLAEKLTARDCLGLPNIVLLNLESLINTEFAELPELSKAIESCQQQPESLQGVYPNAERRTKLEAEWLVAILQPSSFAAAAAQLVELAASKKEGRLQAAPSLEARR